MVPYVNSRPLMFTYPLKSLKAQSYHQTCSTCVTSSSHVTGKNMALCSGIVVKAWECEPGYRGQCAFSKQRCSSQWQSCTVGSVCWLSSCLGVWGPMRLWKHVPATPRIKGFFVILGEMLLEFPEGLIQTFISDVTFKTITHVEVSYHYFYFSKQFIFRNCYKTSCYEKHPFFFFSFYMISKHKSTH